ncbi:monocarboxylate transporter 13-like [Ptychodera flava]|uniref:monocarboxylate transporter 13-like n=1 Tax=Ptychodera flava TaxID=63121 RepID=UPI00396A3B7F
MTMKTRQRSHHDDVLDGGWGWFVVLHCHMLLILLVGLTHSLGVLVVRWVEYFGDDLGAVSWVPSLAVAVQLFTAPFAGALSERFGCRHVAAVGAIVSSIGWISSSFAESIPVLWFTCGILTGIGYGLAYVPSVSLIGQYFERRHALANGIAYAGSGLGMIAMPPLWLVLINTYGWRGALLIAGATNMNLFGTSLLLRPLPSNLHARTQKTVGEWRCLSSNTQETGRKNGKRVALWQMFGYLKVALFYTNELFSLMVVAMLLNAFGYFLINVHMIPNAVYLGVPELRASFLQTVVGTFSLFARLTHGFFVGLAQLLSPVRLYLASTAVCGVAAFLMSTTNDYLNLAIYAATIGIGNGVFMPIIAVAMKDFVGPDHLSSALGLSFLCMGVGESLGPPVGGWLFDRTGNYQTSFCVAGGALLLAATILLLEMPLRRRRERRLRAEAMRDILNTRLKAKRLCDWDAVSITVSLCKESLNNSQHVTQL